MKTITVRGLRARAEAFLEIAVAADAPLVTGNLRHFPAALRAGADVLAPAAFLDRLRR